MAQQIKESQMMDETIDWVYYGNFPGKLRGINNEMSAYLETLEPNTTVRMLFGSQNRLHCVFRCSG